MKLHSFDEWSPLREIVLGSASGYREQARDLSFHLFFYDNLVHDNPKTHRGYYPRLATGDEPADEEKSTVSIKKRYVDELHEDVEGMAEALESLGVRVRRPIDIYEGATQFSTLAWSAAALPPLNVRDNTLILGNEIVETPPMMRSRYFETQLLKPLFMEYFEHGARWTVMPRPWMTDHSFDLSYAEQAGGMEFVPTVNDSPYDVGIEMLFDAAQCLRFGRDLLVNIATENHLLAVEWLERHLEGRYTIHRMHRLTDSHIDSVVLPLRPGTLLIRSRQFLDYLPVALQKWDVIEAPEPKVQNFPQYDEDDVILTSPFIDLNVLSIDEHTVMINDSCPELGRVLEQHGFDVVPVRHRHRRLFGGGLHCFTLDTVRDGGLEDYFS
ncbi:glycine amidinotransferase [Saccharopolyspora lacisalsi]|uniref:Glycine amidinotransferase n=1 Tax=Halosaccharopolyspora lacisalsi TaxID=1000566 RepID=A0A839E3C1_9PSEU|nr:glycine amidinotransferase [Halosaccharopolyspora lacisalsi]MBA8827783.1 glycine amidinotransferase [Halosaccharopolyspora lacisalsi]